MDTLWYDIALCFSASGYILTVNAGGVVWTQMGMGCAQAISAAWLTSKMQDHKRPVALAAYVMSIQLANFPGNQLFTAQGKLIPMPTPNAANLSLSRCASVYPRFVHCCRLCDCCRSRYPRLEVSVSFS